MTYELEYRFVAIVLVFNGSKARFDVHHPLNASYDSITEVRSAIDAVMDN